MQQFQAASERTLRVYAFASMYPSAYKPYYDAQFAELVDEGHELSIFARTHISRVHADLVEAYGLGARTQYLLANDPASMLRLLPRIALNSLGHPLTSMRRLGTSADGTNAKSMIKNRVRQLALPATSPDLCLVQSHETLRLVSWLRDVYPSAPVAVYYYGGLPAEAGRLDGETVRDSFAGASAIFALTGFARDEAISLGSPPERTHVLPLGFRMETFPEVEGDRRSDGTLRLITAGRLSEGKGHEVALRALALLAERGPSRFRYEIVGGGPTEAHLRDLVRKLGLEGSVEFSGSMAHEELLGRMRASDLLLLPSIPTETWNETQGAVMQEALLCGALVVASRTGGIPESLPPFMDHLLVPPGEPEALAVAIDQVAHLSPAEAAALAGRGGRWVRENYDNAILMPRLINRTLAAVG